MDAGAKGAADGFTAEPMAYVPEGDEADGFFHVTVARDRVLAEGLKSRRELGYAVQGLGGGHNNQAPDLISLTWCSGKAAAIEEALRLAVRAARGQATASAIFAETAARYRLNDFGWPVRRALGEAGVPADIRDDADLMGLEEWLDAHVTGGERLYGFLQALDDAMEKEFDRTEVYPDRVGLTAPWLHIAAIDPAQIATLAVAVRAGARAELVAEEQELRFRSEDLRVLGPAFGVEADVPPEPAAAWR